MHEKFMQIALQEARAALESGEFPVGCVIADEEGLVCRGRRRNSASGNEMDHAEIIAMRQLYEHHADRLQGRLVAYATMEPCLMCYSTLILSNIHTIVYAYEDVMGGGTTLSLAEMKPLYSGKNVEIIPHVLRQESLALFKQYFEDNRNDYWKNSLLAQYTLQQ